MDILVNNARNIARHPAADFPTRDWDRVLRTNLDAVVDPQPALRRSDDRARLRKDHQHRVVLSFSGGITVPAYAASKHAVAGLTKALANEWASHNVQVNAIAPGYFATDNTQRLREHDSGRVAEINARIPAGRWGQPRDLAGAVVFLASDAANYVNGHVLVVDGGWMAR